MELGRGSCNRLTSEETFSGARASMFQIVRAIQPARACMLLTSFRARDEPIIFKKKKR